MYVKKLRIIQFELYLKKNIKKKSKNNNWKTGNCKDVKKKRKVGQKIFIERVNKRMWDLKYIWTKNDYENKV